MLKKGAHNTCVCESGREGEERAAQTHRVYNLLEEASKPIDRFGATFPPHKQKRQTYAAMSCDMCLLGWSTASK